MLLQCRHVALACLLGPACAQTFVPLVRPMEFGRSSAFDTVRRRLVMFDSGGATWEFDGGNLLARTPENGSTQPSPRVGHAMCYDEVRRRVLMFGGSISFATGGTVVGNETWAYDGSRWMRLTGPAPAARSFAAMTWDATRDRTVMWGGVGAGLALLSDTWEHDGSTWLQRAPATSPSSGDGAMAFDRQRSVAVLVVRTGSLPNAAQTWEWNGTNWNLRATLNNAGVNGAQAMAFDPTRNRTVLAGTDTRIHEWDGTSWSSSGTLPQPFLRARAASWFDPGCGCVVLAGGIDPSSKDRADVWGWNGQALTPLRSDAGPRASGGVMIADPPRGRVVYFGGFIDGSHSDATWALANGIWSPVPSLPAPSARTFAAATHDLLRGESLLFGGQGAAGLLGDTWSLGGAGWVARSTTGPGPRGETAMAADLVRGVVVLFGGRSSVFFGDTWEWNGTLWTQRATTIQPSPRSGLAMAFHPMLGRMLLFGGNGPSGFLSDTWTWDGSQWTQLFPATQPPQLLGMAMATDLNGNRCILVGTDGVRRQVWTFDGTDWQQALDEPATFGFWKPCTNGAGLGTMVCSREVTPAAALELTFSPGRVATIGAGCGTPASTLATRSRPRAGGNNGLELVANPGRAVLFALDLASGSTPIGGGCTIWLSPSFLGLFQISDASGFASQPLSLPASGFGLDLLAQAAVLEPLSSGGLVLTQGLRLTLGD